MMEEKRGVIGWNEKGNDNYTSKNRETEKRGEKNKFKEDST